jgi:cobalt-zinc-cadmium efflux system protein
MKSDRKILVAFLLNLSFSVFEAIGGAITGSVAIFSDALHDMGDAASIGISYFLERKSKQQPDDTYTYGYARYSVLGSIITLLILLIGSVLVVYNAIHRLIHPVAIHYDGMILMAFFGIGVNFGAAWFTREGDSLNQKAVNLHMLEDCLGWAVVLVGAVIMRFTNIVWLDSIMSLGVAVYIFINAFAGMKEALDVILEKTPQGVDIARLKADILQVEGVLDAHHIHVWTLDGQRHYATAHVVSDDEPAMVKMAIRKKLHAYGIGHVTLELEEPSERCNEKHCQVAPCQCQDGHSHGHSHHHHHHHGHHHH